jgi:hypothetical protein
MVKSTMEKLPLPFPQEIEAAQVSSGKNDFFDLRLLPRQNPAGKVS